MSPCIRDAAPGDEAEWRQLWTQYLAFYGTTLDPAITTATWRRLFDPASTLFCRVTEVDGRVDGFAVCMLHEGTWVTQPVCYLEDLFVAPDQRGSGLGRALIDDLLALGRARGWARLYWHTAAGNAAARRVYDRFGAADDHVRYRIPLA